MAKDVISPCAHGVRCRDLLGTLLPPRVRWKSFVAGLRRACVIFGPDPFDAEISGWADVGSLTRLERQGKECAMPYCITLRSRTDERITGWYVGGNCRWSTDHKRQKRFENKRDAGTVCEELRHLCPRNAKVINIEVTEGDPNLARVSRPERA